MPITRIAAAGLKWLKVLAQLSRIAMAPLTVSVPILGLLAVDLSPSSGNLVGLGVVGLCAHIFGFGLNDLIDFPLDRTVTTRQRHPLITGALRKWQAWTWILLQVPLSLLIYRVALDGNSTGLLILFLSILLSVIYNLWSKWGWLPRFLAELGLAASIGLLCLSGSALTGNISSSAALYALTLALVLLLLNSVPSGLKDLQTDTAFGADSFVQSTGTRMDDEDRMVISVALRRYSAVLQGSIIVGLVGLIVLLEPAPLVTILVILLTLYAALHLRMLLAVRSFQALRRSLPLLNGYYNYAALLLVLIDRMPRGLQGIVVVYVIGLLTVPLRLMLRLWRRRHAPVPNG